MSKLARTVALAAVMAAGACDSAPAEDRTGATAGTPAAAEPLPTRVALPGLFDIMTGLQGGMEDISRSIWRQRYDRIAEHAEVLAEHRKVPADEQRVLRGVLGDDVIEFNRLDRNLHDLAGELAAAAGEGDMAAVMAADAALRQGCVHCHDRFRDRLRDAID